MNTTILSVVCLGLIIAVAVLGWQLWRTRQAYKVFFDTSQPGNLQKRLNDYAKSVDEALNKLDQLATFSANLHKKSLEAVSKIGLVRFNPFDDTGGDQSFCLALLNNHNTGLVISSIHARTGTRFYAKQINDGKPSHPLSEEERRAYDQAIGAQKK